MHLRRGQLSLQSNEIFWQNEPNSEEIASSCRFRELFLPDPLFSRCIFSGRRYHETRAAGAQFPPQKHLQRAGVRSRSHRESRGRRGRTPKLTDLSVTKTVALRLEAKVREEAVDGTPAV